MLSQSETLEVKIIIIVESEDPSLQQFPFCSHSLGLHKSHQKCWESPTTFYLLTSARLVCTNCIWVHEYGWLQMPERVKKTENWVSFPYCSWNSLYTHTVSPLICSPSPFGLEKIHTLVLAPTQWLVAFKTLSFEWIRGKYIFLRHGSDDTACQSKATFEGSSLYLITGQSSDDKCLGVLRYE